MKTKNDSMGTLKLKLDVTPENIEYLKSLLLKPENKISNVISSDTMLFNSKPVEKSTEDLPTVATLRTQFGFLQEGDIVCTQSNNKHVYVGIVNRFTDKTVYLKNVTYVSINESDKSICVNSHPIYSALVQEIISITKNQQPNSKNLKTKN